MTINFIFPSYIIQVRQAKNYPQVVIRVPVLEIFIVKSGKTCETATNALADTCVFSVHKECKVGLKCQQYLFLIFYVIS